MGSKMVFSVHSSWQNIFSTRLCSSFLIIQNTDQSSIIKGEYISFSPLPPASFVLQLSLSFMHQNDGIFQREEMFWTFGRTYIISHIANSIFNTLNSPWKYISCWLKVAMTNRPSVPQAGCQGLLQSGQRPSGRRQVLGLSCWLPWQLCFPRSVRWRGQRSSVIKHFICLH